MHRFKAFIRALMPQSVLAAYHKSVAMLANLLYGRASERLLVIGITGTKGKSTTGNMLWAMLQANGLKTGVLSTAVIRIGDQEFPNTYKMTMPGRFQVQKWLRLMLKQGCQAVVLETTSQGISQFRHLGVNYDAAVLTNLFPEHIEAHGGFENYARAKEELFAHLSQRPHKMLRGQNIPKVIVVNADVPQAQQFLRHPADTKVRFSRTHPSDLTLADIPGWQIHLPGQQNLENVLAALAVIRAFHLSEAKARQGIENLRTIPGRMEEFQSESGITVVVDYAHEPVSIELLYKTYQERLNAIGRGQLICVTGSAGGGRDTSRRPQLGELAGRYCAQVVVTNEDPYDDDPALILQQVAEGALKAGKKLNIDLHIIADRRAGITKAISLAKPGDIVLCSGKGSEQAIVVANGHKIPWDEREVVKSILSKSLAFPCA